MSNTMLDVFRGPSKKQIRTSKISVFIVLAGQMGNGLHFFFSSISRNKLVLIPEFSSNSRNKLVLIPVFSSNSRNKLVLIPV